MPKIAVALPRAFMLCLIAYIPVVGAYPIPGVNFSWGNGINFDLPRSRYCCINYNATSNLLVASSIGQMSVYVPDITFEGTWLLETRINEQFQVTDRGSVSLFGDIGNGYEQLLGGYVTGIGFADNRTEIDIGEEYYFYGAAFMGIEFKVKTANELMRSIFGRSGIFLAGVEIGDRGEFQSGERDDSPFAQDFTCSFNSASYRCEQFEGSFGINALTKVPEPGTLALLGIGLAGIGFARRRREESGDCR